MVRPKRQPDASEPDQLPEFNDAVEYFRGYKSFINIPPEIFERIAQIISSQEIMFNHARDRIAQVLMEDLVIDKKRNFSYRDRQNTLDDLRENLTEEIRRFMPGALRLVHSAD